MKSVSSFAVVGLVAFTAIAVADESSTPSNRVPMVARADLDNGSRSLSLEDYAGRYELENGEVVVVFQDGDTLAIELPQSSLEPMQLRGVARNTFTTDTDVRVTFQTDVNGRVDGLIAFRDGQLPANAVKASSPRGLVTIHDLEEADAPVRRGFVTIHDIDPPTPVYGAGATVLAVSFNP